MTEETALTPTSVPDLSGTVFQETAELPMLIPGTSDLSGWTITLAGPSHPKAVAFQDDLLRRQGHEDALIKQAQINGRKYKADEKSPAERRAENMAWITSRIVTWTPVAFGGKTYEFSDANVKEVFIKPEMGGYFQQVIDYLNSEKAFTKTSAPK